MPTTRVAHGGRANTYFACDCRTHSDYPGQVSLRTASYIVKISESLVILTLGSEVAIRMRVFREARHWQATFAILRTVSAPYCKA
jgi:hypothetical protein